MEKIFKIETVRAGTVIVSATESSDVPFAFNPLSKLVIAAEAESLREDHKVIMVGDELATVFQNMAVDFEIQGTFYGYLDLNAQVNSRHIGTILGCPIYHNSDLSPYSLTVVVFRESPDKYLDAVYQVAKDFAPKL